MAKRISLREYQEGVVARLKTAASAEHVDAHLGVRIGDANWLVDLADVAEVMPVPQVSGVPLAQPWFRGVSNVRGNLVSVSDISAFFGGPTLTTSAAARLILLHPRHILHSAVLVDRMLGLKHLADMQGEATQSLHPWAQAQFRDAAGGQWQTLDVARLAVDPHFLQAGVN
ncbi:MULTISPECIES: chemotaxis protein CheW [Silvimonas]|uniref:chemotaxis protein CheW n=1 Tax=Silvimonas TaxID=300264 RepID=UPI0024B34F9D|nr:MULTISPECIES: chemotaxis protein CheW [Silvimonas]MDR3427629.1 chemotaxis protein CheW [Silvimonas sp.]